MLLQRTQAVWANLEGKGSSDFRNFVLHWTNSNKPHEHTGSVTTEQLHFIHYRKNQSWSPYWVQKETSRNGQQKPHGPLWFMAWSHFPGATEDTGTRASEVNKQVGYLKFKLHCFIWHSKGAKAHTAIYFVCHMGIWSHTCNMPRKQL